MRERGYDLKYFIRCRIALVGHDVARPSQPLVCTWRHGGHVGGQEQKHFSSLGTKLKFSFKLSEKKCYCFDPQHDLLVTWLQTKNSEMGVWRAPKTKLHSPKRFLNFSLYSASIGKHWNPVNPYHILLFSPSLFMNQTHLKAIHKTGLYTVIDDEKYNNEQYLNDFCS